MTDFANDNDTAEMIVVASYPTEADAREKAKLLVENGIGSMIDRGLPSDHASPEPYDDPVKDRDTDEYAAAFELKVMRHQVERACELLGVEVPELPGEAEPEPAKTPWKMILILWAVALVVIPVAAFFVTYYLLK